MNITLTETDVEKAIYKYIESIGINLSDKDFKMDIEKGRGLNKNNITISICIEELKKKTEDFEESPFK